ncbi:MAG: FeoA family protein [archaeon]|nr:FeoA family protein [archaeon]
MSMALSMANEGSVVKIKDIVSGERMKKRLGELGLYEGTSVLVSKNDVCGPVVLKVLDSSIVVGRGQAMKIMVE